MQIREAATRHFTRQGYVGTAMRQIADEAQVSERTAYLAFASTLDLFFEAVGVALAGDDRPVPVAERPDFRAVVSERNGKTGLRRLVTSVSNVNERSGPLIMAANESAGADHALRDTAAQGERAFAQDMTLVAEALGAHGALHPDLDGEEATDILCVLLSPRVHQMLRRDRTRSRTRYRTTVLRALERALLSES